MPVRRSLAEPKLVARPSPYSSSVTLFDASDVSPTVKVEETQPVTPRRSARAKKNVVTVSYKEDTDENEFDPCVKVEPVSPSAKPRPLKKRKLDVLQDGRGLSRSPKKSKPLRLVLDTPHPEPENWRIVYDEIREMRKRHVAPVETMGCASAQLQEKDPKVQLLHISESILND